ncbi:GH36-type glycosyl hydrolase domain-containing protein [Roseicitreum antarcticum]|uniref:Cyclic beta-1,2-glucan synthetase n=1 Tax=Roseicitreum antarcticum TaxID=564137 RepID=A0A1H2TQY3_9RHOB|nr:glucoamylase family protein [Roseicitreum antarcticum]SDW46281.1 cyclic beta-1,2-glucan synthetase [Roseicitreum antarcticum]
MSVRGAGATGFRLRGVLGRPLAGLTAQPALWQDQAVIRSELFGTERLEHHALSLATAQGVARGASGWGAAALWSRLRLSGPPHVRPLTGRVKDNAAFLLGAYRACAQSLQAGRPIAPAAEWLLDNFHLVEQQLRQIDDDLPVGYYRQLPKLEGGPFAGYPRVFGLTWAYVAHTDSLLSGSALARFVKSYQDVSPLSIGELWAVAITLRIVLVENMRRLAQQILQGDDLRVVADGIVDQVLAARHHPTGSPQQALLAATAPFAAAPLDEIIAAQIAKRLRGFDPAETPLHAWLEDRLHHQGSSIEAVVQHAQQRQGASNVTMRNIVTSMRLASELDWAEFVEDVSLIDSRLRARSGFADMDFATRNSYRTAVEVLARGSSLSELAVTDAALELAARGARTGVRAEAGAEDATGAGATVAAVSDPGHGLIGPGRSALEHAVGFAPAPILRLGRWLSRLGLAGYLGAIAVTSAGVLVLALWATGAGGWALIVLALTGVVAASETGTALVNLAVARTVRPRRLPGMDLSKGIPSGLRTLVAVPVLLNDRDDLLAQIAQLEVHHLSSAGGALHYALLSDGPDAATEYLPDDTALISDAVAAMGRLNATYPSADGDRFVFLHRHRQWNASEGVWMGWERKRGKLHELNRLLRGAQDTSFMPHPRLPQDVRFVITLDADTRLLRDTVARMIGKMAHPLNRAVFDPVAQRVTSGYGIVQPRVTPALPTGAEGSVFQRVFSSPGGIEPYASADSNVYQDLFGEGSFTGKGIYDVDAFAASLRGRVPDNTMLSHDLFEGVFARAGLASDIDVVDAFPARYDVAARRLHRWVRGDWQLLPWLIRRDSGLSALGRWKMADNLRRAVVAPLSVLTLFAGWLMPPPVAAVWTVAVLLMLALPHLIGLPFAVLPGRAGITSRSHFAALLADTRRALAQIALNTAFLADAAWQMADAGLRTVLRLTVTRRHLLQWVTAAAAGAGVRPGPLAQYGRMAGGLGLGLGTCGVALALNPAAWPVVGPFAALWLAAPALAYRVSRPRAARVPAPLAASEVRRLRLIARRTWRYFETFVTEGDNFLPPDNFQETPSPTVFHRTSPTNIGLYLLSTTVARDMGWIGQACALTRLEQTLRTVGRMPRFRGHLYNWHDTRDLSVLAPAYVSSVDSGNLAGHLIAVAQTCCDWRDAPVDDAERRAGLADALALVHEALSAKGTTDDKGLAAALAPLSAAHARQDGFSAMLPLAAEAAAKAREIAGLDSDAAFWCGAAQTCIAEHLADAAGVDAARLTAVEDLARRLAMEMDFAFLLDPEKRLLSIGFSVATNARDPNCYDLLASEARLASLFAIAKGDVATRHWFRLGRAATPVGAGSALISWSGSMFEYLMPSLVMRAPVGSVLEQTNRLIVDRQIAYGAAHDMLWGVSESSYNARDLEMTYQYSNFGVPGLGLKRGLNANRVIAPYATGLATMVDAHAAVRNFVQLAKIGAEGRHGFYEAVDFTPARLPAGAGHAIVRSFMAHHQGMTIAAIANTLQGGRLRTRFHAEPMIRAVDLLLQERVPRDATATPPRAEDVPVSATAISDAPVVRRFAAPGLGAPTGHLLSNGSYGVMLTPTGGGFSRWRDLAITRWRPEASHNTHGAFIFARDAKTGALWSAGVQPVAHAPGQRAAVFCEHHAAFTHQDRKLAMTTEVLVSAEDDAEARRVTLTNTGGHAREIDLTSYAELVLAPAASDLAHPAFSKMFVVTDFMPELGALIATRRRRSPTDPEVWAAHIAVVEGAESAPVEYETDRARFIGRGRSIGAAVMADSPLSGNTGTVLDPIFAMRRRVLVPPGGMVRVTFWTMVTDSPEALLDQVDRHRDPSAFERAETLSWTQGQVQLRHLGISPAAAADFQRLGGMILRGDTRLRATDHRNDAGPQAALWAMGVSGDLPIILFRISDTGDAAALDEVLAAHEYLRMRQLDVDLVVLNDRASSYVQDMQTAIEVAVRSAQSRPRSEGHPGGTQGAIHILRADLVTEAQRGLLLAVAQVSLRASRGGIGDQIDGLAPVPSTEGTMVSATPPCAAVAGPEGPEEPPATPLPALEFFNGTGGFAEGGREYVTILRDGQTTPAPWLNVIANPDFGFQVSAEGSGHVWAENSRENQLTPWSNDPVCDPAGEAIYLRDMDSGAVWTPTALPIRTRATYIARHGFGYSRFEHTAHGIVVDMVQFVPMEDPVKITRLTLRNPGDKVRNLSITAYAEWVLGTSRSATASHIVTSQDTDTGAIFAQNPFATAFPGRVAFADLGEGVTSHSADRAEVLGRAGSMAAPSGIGEGALSGRTGPALDPCAALQRPVTLKPGESVQVVFLLGQAASAEDARALILRHRAADPEVTLQAVREYWTDLLGAVQVTSPDRAMDIMLNGWLLYQTLACRIRARAGFYQASGAYGFRDQLQDGMALTATRPEIPRAHLLRAASRQFPQGDVQHWWLPHSGQGVRTRISDDRVWLGYGVAQYVAVSGDAAILDEQVAFLDGPALPEGAHDDFFQPSVSDTHASLFEHCARGIDLAIDLTGVNGMPLIGSGDWNDGMNRVGEGGQGTSVWLGWLLIATIDRLAPFADSRDPARAGRWRAHRQSVLEAIEQEGWDGAWYRRGTYDDGTPLGSAISEECRIDSIAQSWAVLSGAADPGRAAVAMASMTEHLVRPEAGLALLFTPPFDRTPLDPGYIKGYPPGLRENGGQYSHAAMWAILAHCGLGDGDAAGALFALVNPVNHALTPADAARYKVEPYVVAADVYSTGLLEGRGGWTWYTGSAGWMYRAGIEGLLGLTRAGPDVILNPCFPKAWTELKAMITIGEVQLSITIDNAGGSGFGVHGATMDGVRLPVTASQLRFPLSPGAHALRVQMC